MSDSVRPHRRQPTRLPGPWDSPGKYTGVGCHFFLQCMKMKSESEVAQLCPTLSDLMDCILSGSSVHGIPQARMLEWVAISFSRGSSWSRDRTWVYCIGKWILYYLSHQGRPLEAGYQVAYADLVTDLLYDINLARAKLLLLLLSCFSHVRLCATP